MRTRSLAIVAATAVFLAGGFMHSSRMEAAPAPQSSGCDRACLTGIIDQYVAAMVKHDPTGLPLAAKYKYTENTATIPLGDGLWVGASEAPTTFKIYGIDPVTGQAGLEAVMKEFDKPVLLFLRLKVEGGKITEIEHIVVREVRPTGMPNFVTPRRGLLATVPPGERVPRDQMIKIANSYFDSIEMSNGDVAPYADDCVRHENGMQTTTNKTPQPGPMNSAAGGGAANNPFAKLGALGCADSMNTHGLMYITKIWPRRPLIVDEDRGLVFTFPMFVHRGNIRSIKISGVPGLDTVPMNFGPIDLQAGEIFKIQGGKIHDIEAIGYLLPYNMKTGWE